jgi:hypothetical protein
MSIKTSESTYKIWQVDLKENTWCMIRLHENSSIFEMTTCVADVMSSGWVPIHLEIIDELVMALREVKIFTKNSKKELSFKNMIVKEEV